MGVVFPRCELASCCRHRHGDAVVGQVPQQSAMIAASPATNPGAQARDTRALGQTWTKTTQRSKRLAAGRLGCLRSRHGVGAPLTR